MFHAGLPFHLSDDPDLDAFLIMYEQYIVPGLWNWCIPDPNKIAQRMMDTKYDSLMSQVFTNCFTNADYKTVGSDAWSNVRSDFVLKSTTTCGKGTVMLNAEYSKMLNKDANYVARKLAEAKKGYESLNVDPQRATIVYDNASTMGAANNVLHSKYNQEMDYPQKLVV